MENKNNTFEEIWDKLNASKRILMKLHEGPDGDSLGSCTAMKQILEKKGVEVTLISKDNLSDNLSEFSFVDEVDFGKGFEDYNLNNFDLILFLDHGAPTYSSENIEKVLKNNFIINIDHHEGNEYYGKLNYVDQRSSSTCSILVEFFEKFKIEFDKELCRKLFLGICTDTGFLKYGDVLDNLKKAAFLIEKGNINYLKEFLDPITASSWGLKKLQGKILSNMKKKKIKNKRVVYSFVTREDEESYNLNLAEIRLGILCMQGIKDTDLVFVLKERDNHIKGSFRSQNIDTSLISRELGGGGHKKASAFNLESMPLKEAINKVFEAIEKVGLHEIVE